MRLLRVGGLIGLTVLPFLSLDRACASGVVKLAWDPSPEENVIGYRIHYGPEPRTYTTTVDAKEATTFSLTGLTPEATYFCAVTAYNSLGLESDYSNEISFTCKLPPGPVLPDGDGITPEVELGEEDDDGNGLSSLEEYAHGFGPWDLDRGSLIAVELMEEVGVSYLAIRYEIDAFTLARVAVEVQRSLDLTDPEAWHSDATVLLEVRPSSVSPGMVEYVERSRTPSSENMQEFFRLHYRVRDP